MTTRLCSSISSPKKQAWPLQTPVLFSTTVVCTSRKSQCLFVFYTLQYNTLCDLLFYCTSVWVFLRKIRISQDGSKHTLFVVNVTSLTFQGGSWRSLSSHMLCILIKKLMEIVLYVFCRVLYLCSPVHYLFTIPSCLSSAFHLGVCHVWVVPTSATGVNTDMTVPTTLAHVPFRRDVSKNQR